MGGITVSFGAGTVPTFPFFVGCGRSGTTLLRAMFDSHPEMAIPHESYFVVSFGRRLRRYEEAHGFDVDRFALDLLGHRWFLRWGLSEDELWSALAQRPPHSFPEAVRDVFSLYARRRGKLRYGDKTPSYVLNIRLLAGLFPEGRFVHIIRDGRDVALSLLDVQFGPNTLDEAALFWRLHVQRGQRVGRALGHDRYREIRYERLLDEPEASLRGLCEFVGIDFDEAMLRYHDRAADVMKDFRHPQEQRSLLLPPTAGLRNWRTEMSEEDLVHFEALAGDLLGKLGYERALTKLPVRTLLAARRRKAELNARRAARRARKRVITREG